jgi:NADH dehydrogenase/putative oxidoreductase
MDTSNRTAVAIRAQRRAWVAGFMGTVAEGFRIAERSAGPIVDLLIRFWLAGIFFTSAVIKLADWQKALYLSAYEYPVSWLDSVTAAYLGVSVELLGAVLLAIGLATRFAALSMLVLSLVIQFNYVALEVNLFWAVLFGWYVARGAGPLSIDHLLSRGLADSALPLAASGSKTMQAFSAFSDLLYRLFMRVWIAAAVISSILVAVHAPTQTALGLLPSMSAAQFSGLGLICAVLLGAGLATRVTAAALMLLTFGLAMTSVWDSIYAYWLALFALFALYGPGRLSVDAVIEQALRRLFPQLDGKPVFSLEGLPRVVIIGAGFGGLTCATALRRTPVQITLIDRQNYHLFQPLLYQVATASLSPGDVATPVRGMCREQFNARVLLGNVTGVDATRQEVLIGNKRVPYDHLVIATGAQHNYFGRDEWERYAPGLKRIDDAVEVRRRLLTAFEQAENSDDAQRRASLLTFIIVGAGPTGVELAGAIAELAKHGMEKDFRNFDPASARVILIQAGSRVLPTFSERLSAVARASLERLGVEVLTDSRVEHIDDEGVIVNGKRIAARTVLWAAGVVASPAARWLGMEADRAGRLKVGPDLSVPGLKNVFAIGDTALSIAWAGQPVPGLAPAAKQAGAYVAKVIRARVMGRKPVAAFTYQHLGSLATIGRKSAVVEFGLLRLSGTSAWWLWGLIHIYFLVGLRNRLSVMFDWFWAYLTYRSGTRLITGDTRAESQSESVSAPASAPVSALHA